MADAGTTEPAPPSTPSDVPAVRLEADPATACTGKFTAEAPVDGWNRGFPSAGQSRNFYLKAPGDTSAPRPLLVAFNGTSEDGEAIFRRAKLQEFVDAGFIVVAPSSNKNGTKWPIWDALRDANEDTQPNPDLEYFDQLVQCTAAHFPVDKNRIYITGHSAGGIMTNYVVQRRSELVAGAIVGSGVFSLTSPADAKPLDPVAVMVTWGGSNDIYRGAAGSVSVAAFNFVEQASLASVFYSEQPNVGQAHCKGNSIGHAWLPINAFFIQFLLDHPKGLSGKTGMTLPEVATPRSSCSTEPYVFQNDVVVTCAASNTEGCQASCQLFGDCAVANATVSSAIGAQLSELGFSGAKNADCGGCLRRCESKAKTAADAQVLSCIQRAQGTAQCGPGLDGVMPLVEAINQCCTDRRDSPYCVDVCTVISKSSAAAGFFKGCKSVL